jgi:hypothetical protein
MVFAADSHLDSLHVQTNIYNLLGNLCKKPPEILIEAELHRYGIWPYCPFDNIKGFNP